MGILAGISGIMIAVGASKRARLRGRNVMCRLCKERAT
jgi:hypothetical protein